MPCLPGRNRPAPAPLLLVRPLLALLLLALAGAPLRAQEPEPGRFRGSDGEFDISGYLASRGGFLPVPIVVTEPAIGYGGGLAGLVFHGGNPFVPGRPRSEGRFVPPSISAAGVLATENGSKGGALVHLGFWREDRIRYVGAAAAASLNLDYWGTSSRPLDDPLSFNVRGGLVLQRLLVRLGESPVLLGGEAVWSTQEAEFDARALPPGSPPRHLEQDDVGVGLVAEYDTLDNIFTPSRGVKGRLRGMLFSTSLGGDNDRESLDVEAFGWMPLHERFHLGLRGDFAFSDGETPFYLRPFVVLRGAPAMKFSGKHSALGEVEARWRVHGRWSAVLFGGVGFTADSVSDLGSETAVDTLGTGVRYLVAERLGLQVGLDVARSADDRAVYIIVGSAWR